MEESRKNGDGGNYKDSNQDQKSVTASVGAKSISQSMISARSKSVSTKPKRIVYQEDPHSKLIPTDEQWSKKVEADFLKYNQENKNAKISKYERNKAV